MKSNANHRLYIEVLRAMGAERRLRKALELSELARELFLTGLRERCATLEEAALRALYLKRLEKSWNRRD